jgi:tetratricopeptide (TPR) repeat protein
VGDWARTEELWNTASEIFERLGDHRSWEGSVGNKAIVKYLQGDFDKGLELANTAYLSSFRRNASVFQVILLMAVARLLLSLGQLEQAMTCLESARSLLAEHTDMVGVAIESDMYGMLVSVYLEQKEYQKASSAAQHLENLLAKSPMVQFDSLLKYASLVEARLALWETSEHTPDIAKLANRACKSLERCARTFPIGRPRAWLSRGRCLWLSGKTAKAHQFWRKSLVAAAQLAMPYEQGLAHYEIGRHMDADAVERATHLHQAIDIFDRLGAGPARERAQAALDT